MAFVTWPDILIAMALAALLTRVCSRTRLFRSDDTADDESATADRKRDHRSHLRNSARL